jgi:hypothetical protein
MLSLKLCGHSYDALNHDQDIPAVKIDFLETGVHQIDATSVQFPEKISCGTAESCECYR